MDFEVYVNGERVVIRGVERAEEEYGETHPRSGEWETFAYLHVEPVERAKETTTRVPIGSVKCDGGASALYDHLFERGLIPAWFYEGREPDETLEA